MFLALIGKLFKRDTLSRNFFGNSMHFLFIKFNVKIDQMQSIKSLTKMKLEPLSREAKVAGSIPAGGSDNDFATALCKNNKYLRRIRFCEIGAI